jgi:predicted nucleic acid-binding protein
VIVVSSLAAGDAVHLLSRLFFHSTPCIPPAVYQELQAGLDRGKAYLEPVLQAIATNEIQVLPLSDPAQRLIQTLPQTLGTGEREAIVLAQTQRAALLSNDKRAIRYCQEQGIRAIDLPNLLRLLWTRRIISPSEVDQLITKMEQVENLTLTQSQRSNIFARPRR